jgi:hypothetical protein
MQLIILILIFISSIYSDARIRLRKVKEAPRVCQVMKEDQYLSRPEKKILGTEKNSLIFDGAVTLIGDLGHKQCEWPLEKFAVFQEPRAANYYIDEFKNVLIAYKKVQVESSNQKIVQQLQINVENCQISDLSTLSEPVLPKCDPPKKGKKKKKSTKAKTA